MIDVREEIANAPIGPYHWFLALLIGAVVFFDGYDTFNPAYVIHHVMKPRRLAPSRASLLVSSGLIVFVLRVKNSFTCAGSTFTLNDSAEAWSPPESGKG